MEFSACLAELARNHADRTALADDGAQISYPVLLRRVNSVSQTLYSGGCRAGSRILTVCYGCQEYVELLLACAQLGVQLTLMSIRAGREEILEAVRRIEPDFAFLLPEVAQELGGELLKVFPRERVVVFGRCDPYLSYSRMTLKHTAGPFPPVPADAPVVSSLYGGAVTDVLTYGEMAEFAVRHLLPRGAAPGTLMLCIPYMAVRYALEVLYGLARGMCLALIHHVSPKSILRTAARYRVTETLMTPSLISVVARDALFFRGDLKGVRVLRLGLAYLDADAIANIRTLFSPECVIVKHFRERRSATRLTLPVCELCSGGDVLQMRVNSVGQAIPGASVCVLDRAGRPLEPECWGNLYVRWPLESEETLHSLDAVGWMDRDGFVYLSYRSLPEYLKLPPHIVRAVAGDPELDREQLKRQQISLAIFDEMLEDFSLAEAEPSVPEVRKRLAEFILTRSRAEINSIAIVFPLQGSNLKLNTGDVMGELASTSVTELPQRFYTITPEGVRELPCSAPDFPGGLSVWYYPLHTLRGRLIGEVYFALREQGELDEERRLHLYAAVRHLQSCLSSVERRIQSETMLDLMKAALDLVSDGVGISDIGFSPALLYSNRSSAELIGKGKADRAFGELLERSQTQNMNNLRYGARDKSSSSYYYPDAEGRNIWVSYAAQRVRLGDEDYAICISNTRKDENWSAEHLQGLLSDREIAVLEVISAGLSSREAARRLNVSDNTIKYHLSHIYAKLGVKNRAELLSSTYLNRR